MYTVYGKPNCPWCDRVKNLLEGEDVRYVDLSIDSEALSYIKSQGFKTVPQVFHNGVYIGGYEATSKFIKENT